MGIRPTLLVIKFWGTAATKGTYILTTDYKGEIFVLPVEGGSRTYKLVPETEGGKDMLRKENRLMMLLGFLLSFSGLIGFFVEHRLNRTSSF